MPLPLATVSALFADLAANCDVEGCKLMISQMSSPQILLKYVRNLSILLLTKKFIYHFFNFCYVYFLIPPVIILFCTKFSYNSALNQVKAHLLEGQCSEEVKAQAKEIMESKRLTLKVAIMKFTQDGDLDKYVRRGDS